MKILLLSVALLFFTGAQGRHFWQQDEPAQQQEQTIEKIFDDGVSIIIAAIKSIDLHGIAKEYHIKEKLDAAKKHSEKLEKAMESYAKEVYKRFDEQLKQKFPMFHDKVLPILKEADDKLEEHIKNLVKEALPIGSDLVAGIVKAFAHSFESFEKIAEQGLENVRGEIDKLRVKLEPHVDSVHAEYETYRKSIQDELQKDMKELKESVEKNMAKAKEHLPDVKELQEYFEKALKDFKEYIQSLQ